MHSFARDASTAFNWASREDRAAISINLRTNAEVIAGEILATRGHERFARLKELQRVYTRLAICDMAAARDIERSLTPSRNNDKVAIVLLEHMADALDLDEPSLEDADPRIRLMIARDCAHQLRLVELEEWFSTGPFAGLSMISRALPDPASDDQDQLLPRLFQLVDLARQIPAGLRPDADIPECQAFSSALDNLAECGRSAR